MAMAMAEKVTAMAMAEKVTAAGAIEQSLLTVSKFTNPSFFFINRMEFGRI